LEEKKPLVSIIVRTKDRPKLLRKALKSIAGQTYRPIEVVLVNDGGCELDIGEIENMLSDVNLNYIRLEKNTGRANAGNVGIEYSKGKYVGFLDDDDELFPEHVTVLAGYLEESDLRVAYTDSLIVHREYDPEMQTFGVVKSEAVYSRDFDYDSLLFENYIPFMCLLFDREVLIQSGGLDDKFDLYEDYDLLIRLGEKFSFHHIRKITADYNQWCSASQISQRNTDVQFVSDSYLKLFRKHFDKFLPERIHNYTSAKYMTTVSQSARIRELETLVKLKEEYTRELDSLLKNKDVRIRELAIEKEITHRDNMIQLKDSELLLRNKDDYINDLLDVIKAKEEYAANIISQLNQEDQQLANAKETLRSIYGSRGWRMLLIGYRIRDRILPPDSTRRRLMRKIFAKFKRRSKGLAEI
jgi:glycosyltransferase involved in cell wall biosynthesis